MLGYWDGVIMSIVAGAILAGFVNLIDWYLDCWEDDILERREKEEEQRWKRNEHNHHIGS